MTPPPGGTESTWREDVLGRVAENRRAADLSDADLTRRIELHQQEDESRFDSISKALIDLKLRFDRSDRRQLIGFALLVLVAVGVRTKIGTTILSLMGLL